MEENLIIGGEIYFADFEEFSIGVDRCPETFRKGISEGDCISIKYDKVRSEGGIPMNLPTATQQLYIQIETAFSQGNWNQMIQRCRNLLELKEFFSRYDLPAAMPEFQKDRALRELESSRGAWSTHSNNGRKIEEVRKTTDYRSAKPSLQKGKRGGA